MQKISVILIVIIITGIAHFRAHAEESNVSPNPPAPLQQTDPVQMTMDMKRQIRVPVPVKIKKAIDSTSLLAENGDIYALTGLDFPESDAALDTYKRLSELTADKKCTLYQTRSDKIGRINRMNHILGHFTCGQNDVWIQGTLIAEGHARVRTTPENREQSTAMLELEQQARSKKIGLWGLPYNHPLTPQTAAQHINSFALVEGQVYTTAQNKNSLFLNFTSDWKTDFSIGIPSKLRKDFSKIRIDPASLKGQKIRVRGWIRDYNGPYIELDHVEQLEVVSDNTPTKQHTKNNAEKIIEKILESPEPQEKSEPKKNNQQFMHTIKGPSAPIVEKPAPPDLGKKENGQTN